MSINKIPNRGYPRGVCEYFKLSAKDRTGIDGARCDMPAAAILMGIGYWIDPVGWGNDNALAALLIKSGAAIIDNMSVLFAIGVAYGMSKDKDGAAALTGFVGFLVVTTLCSPAAVSMIKGLPLAEVPVAFGKINNQFVGILVGVLSAELYNRFSSVELPRALSFLVVVA